MRPYWGLGNCTIVSGSTIDPNIVLGGAGDGTRVLGIETL